MGGRARADAGPIPEVLSGRYRIEGEIGAGGFGVVYEALDERLQKRVAVKLLGERHSRDKQQVERFRAEALTAGRLDHACIVAVTDFDILDDGRPYLVMERVAGRPFDEVLAEQTPFDIPRAARVARKLCLALAVAHKHGIVHRDLKPANIIVDGPEDRDDGTLKILDFGVAKLLETRNTPSLTSTGQMLGTPAYMAPEQVRQRGTVLDGRADVYSVGIILYEMLTGKTPFSDRPAGDVLVSKVIDKPAPPSRHRPDLPASLERIVMRAIQPKPAKRFEGAAAMADALAAFTGLTGDEAARLPPVRRRGAVYAGVGLVAAGALAVAFAITRGDSDAAENPAPAALPAQPIVAEPAPEPRPEPEPEPEPVPVVEPEPEPEPEPAPEVEVAETDDTQKPKRKKSRRKRNGDLPDAPRTTIRVPR